MNITTTSTGIKVPAELIAHLVDYQYCDDSVNISDWIRRFVYVDVVNVISNDQCLEGDLIFRDVETNQHYGVTIIFNPDLNGEVYPLQSYQIDDYGIVNATAVVVNDTKYAYCFVC